MASLPSLVVNLALDSATFVSGLTKAEYQAKKSADAIKASIDHIGHTVTEVAALIGIGLGVDAFKEMIEGAIEAEAKLQLLGDRAGITGSQLSAFIGVAARSKTDLETVVQASTKLSKALLDFGNAGAKSTEVLTALGVKAKDVPGLLAAPDQALISIAKTLDQLPAGGTKAAANLLLLGRGGAQAAAFLAELAKTQQLVALRTQAQIESAKELADRFIDLGVKADTLKASFSNALIPSLNAALDVIAEVTSSTGGLQGVVEKLAADGSIKAWADDAIAALAGLLDATKQIVFGFESLGAHIDLVIARSNAPSAKITGSLGFSPEEAASAEAALEKARVRALEADTRFSESLKNLMATNTNTLEGAFRERAARLEAAASKTVAVLDGAGTRTYGRGTDTTFADIQKGSAEVAAKAKSQADAAARVQAALNAGNSGKDDPAKARLEGLLKAQEAAINEEKDLLRTREEFLKAYYDQDLLTLEQYYDGASAARAEALQKTLAAYDVELKAAEAYKAHEVAKGSARGTQEAQNQIEAVAAKQAKAVFDSINQEALQSLNRTKAAQKYSDELSGINAQILSLAGNTAQAAAITFDIKNRGAVAQATLHGDEATLRNIAAIRQQEIVQAGLNDVTKLYENTLGQVAVQQGYINLAQSTGRISEIEALQKQSDLNKAMIPYLEQQVEAYERIAATSADPAAILRVQQMKLAVEQLKTQTDLLADTFNKTFGDAFASAISDLVTGAKTAKQAFQDMIKSVTKSIADIAAKGVASSLFGQGGPLSGIGEIFSKAFGGGGNAKGVDTGAAASAAAKATEAATQTLTAATSTSTAAAALVTAGASLDTAGINLNTVGVTLDSAGITLDSAGITLDSAGITLDSSGITLDAAGVGLDAAGGTLTAAGALLTAAAEAMATSSAVSGASSLISSGSSIFGLASGGLGLGGFASGTDYAAGGMSIVGENGPEIINIPRGAQVIPNDVLMAKREQKQINITQHINVMPGATSQSVRQAAAAVRDATLRSVKDR